MSAVGHRRLTIIEIMLKSSWHILQKFLVLSEHIQKQFIHAILTKSMGSGWMT